MVLNDGLFFYRKESKETLSGYAYTQMATYSHSVLKVHDCLKFLGTFLEYSYLSTSLKILTQLSWVEFGLQLSLKSSWVILISKRVEIHCSIFHSLCKNKPINQTLTCLYQVKGIRMWLAIHHFYVKTHSLIDISSIVKSKPSYQILCFFLEADTIYSFWEVACYN